MKTVKIKAVFKGLNNSCGYKTNSEYTLIIRHQTATNIKIENVNGGGLCEYNSIGSFLENWDKIRNIESLGSYRKLDPETIKNAIVLDGDKSKLTIDIIKNAIYEAANEKRALIIYNLDSAFQ